VNWYILVCPSVNRHIFSVYLCTFIEHGHVHCCSQRTSIYMYNIYVWCCLWGGNLIIILVPSWNLHTTYVSIYFQV
jgi:hypothetical protein